MKDRLLLILPRHYENPYPAEYMYSKDFKLNVSPFVVGSYFDSLLAFPKEVLRKVPKCNYDYLFIANRDFSGMIESDRGESGLMDFALIPGSVTFYENDPDFTMIKTRRDLYRWLDDHSCLTVFLEVTKDMKPVDQEDLAARNSALSNLLKKYLNLGIPNLELASKPAEFGFDIDTPECWDGISSAMRMAHVQWFPSYWNVHQEALVKTYKTLGEASGKLDEWERLYKDTDRAFDAATASECRKIASLMQGFDHIRIIDTPFAFRNINYCSVVLGGYQIYRSVLGRGVFNVGKLTDDAAGRRFVGLITASALKKVKTEAQLERYMKPHTDE